MRAFLIVIILLLLTVDSFSQFKKVGPNLLIEYGKHDVWRTTAKYYDLDTIQLDTNEYRFVMDFGGVHFSKTVEGLWGVISKKGYVVYKPQFTRGTFCYYGIFGVHNGEHMGYLDSTGSLIIPFQFRDGTHSTGESIAAQDTLGDWYLYDLQGKKLTEKAYRKIFVTTGGNILGFNEYNSERFGFMDKRGNIVSEAIYDLFIKPLGLEYWEVEKDGKWGILDGSGKVIVDIIYDSINLISATECIGKLDGKEVEISL